jgi:glycosyltransferase involved in cell wall biosynthesis
MKVAYYSPLPPERSGIADYSSLLLPALERRLEVAVVRRDTAEAPAADVSLYHIGNNPEFHDWIVETLWRAPGVVVLHELVLHHLVAGMTLARDDPHGYVRALERELGLPGRLLALGVLDGSVPPLWVARPEQFPLARFVLDHATGLIAHSRYVVEGARAAGYGGRAWRIPLAAPPRPSPLRPAALEGRPVIGCFGHITPPKRIPQLLEAFGRLLTSYPRARLVLAGQVTPTYDLGEVISRARLAASDAVTVEGYVDDDRLWALMAACDVCVSLRAPTMGETSASALQSLAAGRPLVVSDVGWFSDLPDDVALKIPVDRWEVDLLAAALDLLAGDPALRAAMSEAALDYVAAEHAVEHVADLYAAALEVAAGGDALAEKVLGALAQAAAEIGIGPGSAELAEIARHARDARILA